MPGHEHRAHAREALLDLACHLGSLRAGKHDVGEQEIDAAALPASVTGLLDFARIAEASDAEMIARRHMYWALAAVTCYGTSLALRGGLAPPPMRMGSPSASGTSASDS